MTPKEGLQAKPSSPQVPMEMIMINERTETYSSSEVVWILKLKSKLDHLCVIILMVCATLKSGQQHFLPIECCFKWQLKAHGSSKPDPWIIHPKETPAFLKQ